MHTILGAGGAIGTQLLGELVRRRQPVRLVSRNPKQVRGAIETISADLSDPAQTINAVAGSTVVYLVAGLKYDVKAWRELWPRIMANAIEACKRADAKLVFFDNVYMYGKVAGPMTESTPFNPCSRKGEIRARIASTLLDEIKAGGLTAMIARSADFYGPGAKTSVANILVFEPLAKGARPSCLVSDSVPHSYTYTPDAGKALALLAETEAAWNQTWHVPTAPMPPTGKEFIALAAREFGVEPRYRTLGRPLLRIVGLFNSDVRESFELLYQSDSPYVFDSAKFAKAFGQEPTSCAEGVRCTASVFKSLRADGSPAQE
jgi:nucleoside-diphosphate-sugar epimerase